jgi:hypothetical protein
MLSGGCINIAHMPATEMVENEIPTIMLHLGIEHI